jgi:phosphoglycerate dehydrogenase-like enzyme
MVIITSCPLSERHVNAIREISPVIDLRVYPSIEQAQESFADAEVLITYGEDLTPEIVKEMKRLKWVQVFSAGIDKMPLQQLEEQHVLVTNARGIHRIPLAEHVLGMMLAYAHRFHVFFDLQRTHTWDRSVRLEELYGKTVGIIGVGAIGSAIAEKAKAFQMRTMGVNTTGKSVPFVDETYPVQEMDKVLAESDYVVVIVALTPETEGLIGEREFKQMKKSAIFINVSRGAVVDESALIRALKEEWIGGAALDVFVEEPLPPEHPLWSLPNCVITPHMSGRSPKYMERAQEIFRYNLNVYLNGTGEMINVIDPKKGY